MLLVLTLILPALASPGPRPPANAGEAFKKATKVFVGKVVSVRKDAGGYDSLATVHCQKSLKGGVKGDVSVSGQGGGTEAARIFRAGETYLFYLGDDFHADAWSNRVVNGAEMKQDLKALGR